MIRPAFFVLVSLALPAAAFASLPACGSIGRGNIPVAIADESAIIIWDAKTKTQHFIRRASFDTKAPDLGFLVPTPAQPQLEETDDAAFATLFDITKPKVEKRPQPSGGCGCGKGPQRAVTGSAKVEVLEEKRVGPFDVAVLKASDPAVLEAWLKKNDYPFPKSLREWADPYTKQGWIITAFKLVQKNEAGGRLATAGVRMSFGTDTPLFPYREPKEEKADDRKTPASRLLRVYFLADKRMAGKLEGADWPGRTVWAGEIEAEKRAAILKMVKLPADTGPETWWLTEFEDTSIVRPGDSELFFHVSEVQAPVERRPHVIVASNMCVMSLALTACIVGLSFWRRNAA